MLQINYFLARFDPIKKDTNTATNEDSDFMPFIFWLIGSKYIINL